MWLSMSSIKVAIPVGHKVIPIAVFTYRYLHVTTALSDIFINKWCETHEYIVSESNRAIISSLLRSLTAKLNNFNFVYAKFDIIWSCS